MESSETQLLLTCILGSAYAELQAIKQKADHINNVEGRRISVRELCRLIQHDVPKQIEKLELSQNDEREVKLADFLCNFTARYFEWIEEVKGTQWDAFIYKSQASYLFMRAESLGITGTASFAILVASMVLRGFRVPKDLNRLLHGAKINSAQQVKELADAEKRREAERKNKL